MNRRMRRVFAAGHFVADWICRLNIRRQCASGPPVMILTAAAPGCAMRRRRCSHHALTAAIASISMAAPLKSE